MASVFRERLDALDDEQQEALRDALHGDEQSVTVVTSRALSDEQRGELRQTLRKFGDDNVTPEFEVEDDMICGVELRAGDRRVSWSIAGYLTELEQAIEETVSAAAESSATPKAARKKEQATNAADEKQAGAQEDDARNKPDKQEDAPEKQMESNERKQR
jgi:F-type H+-transporting ATPase subunit b